MKRQAIVTGATGYIGQALTGSLINRGWSVVVIVRPSSNTSQYEWCDRVATVAYDGSLSSLLQEEVSFEKNATVFHLASLSSYECPPSLVDKMLESNIVFGVHLLEAMKIWKLKSFVNTASFWQYSENGDYFPTCLYAATKKAFEDILKSYSNSQAIACANLVLFDVYGPNDHRKKLLSLLFDSAEDGTMVSLSPGFQKIDLVHVLDVVSAYVTAALKLSQDSSGRRFFTYAVNTGRLVTIRELVRIYESLAGTQLKIKWGAREYRKDEIMTPWQPSAEFRLDGWSPEISLEQGLSSLMEKGKRAVT